MSVISNRHSVNVFAAGKSQPLAGQRLAKVGYKSTRKNPAKHKNVCVSVPVIENDAVIPFSERLLPFVRTMLADAQDGIIRSLYESAGGSLTMSIAAEEISVESCVNWLIAEQSGERLNSDMLGAWFDANVRDPFTVILCEQNKIEDTDDVRVQQTVAGYKGVFASINGRNTLNAEQRKEVRNLLKVCECDADPMAQKVIAKLDAMEKVTEGFKASLGFSVGD